MEEPKKKSSVAAFRLNVAAHDRLYSRAEEAGVSTRVWLEQAILDNRTQIISKQKPHLELRPLLFQINKTGNNINQLAHHFNTLKLENKITRDEFLHGLSTLEGIQELLREVLDHAR